MAYTWALIARAHPQHNIAVIASSEPRLPPETVDQPKELLMPVVAGPQTAKPSEYDAIIHLLGRERMPIYFGMLQFKAGLHIFITTQDYQTAANVLSRCLPEACRSKTVSIQDPFKPADTRRAIERQISKLPSKARVAVNLTGGTKLMFAGALAACWEGNLEPFYFEINEHNIIFIRDGATVPFIGAKSVADYFLVNGFDVITNGRWEDNWRRITTMWIGVSDLFERRLGLFPTGWDAQGRMYTRTDLGDLPQVMPDGPRDIAASYLAGWWVQSYRAGCTASSTLPEHGPDLAADENVRSWWSAATGNAGEWLSLDLKRPCTVRAIQADFAEQNAKWSGFPKPGDAWRYVVETSMDGSTWTTVVDRAEATRDAPHQYCVLPKPVTARHVRITNRGPVPGKGLFAVRDLRVFGQGDGATPAAVTELTVKRHEADDRNVTVTWEPVTGVDGYLVRYGVAPDALHLSIQVQGETLSSLTIHALNRGVRYYWRIDTFNRNGVTWGAEPVRDSAP